MLTGRKYRLDLTPEQVEQVETIGNVCRSVWNTALEQRREYRCRGGWMNYAPQCRELAEAKREFPWLAAAPGHCLQQTLKDLDRTCAQYGTFRVKWRSVRRWSPSFRFPEGGKIPVERLGRRWGRCRLPKLGWVRFRWSRALGGQIRSVTVSRDGQHWFVSFLVEDGRSTPEQHTSTSAVGVDRGVTVAVAASDGTMRDREFLSPGEQERYLRLHRQLSRQVKGSVNRKKTLAAMGTIKRRERDRRADFCNHTASRLVTRHGLVALEELDTGSMTCSARGTVEARGTNVQQKAGLNRSILDKGWYAFELALHNTARYTGCRIIKVPAAYTSQRCSQCRSVDPRSRESQARFRCTVCGHCENADVNAARNVLADGLSVSACGDLQPPGGSMKQEPAGTREALPHLPVT